MTNHKNVRPSMIGATTTRTSAGRRSLRRGWTPTLAGLGLVALVTAACGNSGTTATPPATSSSPAPAATQAAFPGAFGTAAAVSGSSLEVQNPTSGQVTVNFTSATLITETVAGASSDVSVGSCVAVAGQPPASGAATSGG